MPLRRPGVPARSKAISQPASSSSDNAYRVQASARAMTPPRIAITTAALRRDDHRFVSAAGSSSVNLPGRPVERDRDPFSGWESATDMRDPDSIFTRHSRRLIIDSGGTGLFHPCLTLPGSPSRRMRIRMVRQVDAAPMLVPSNGVSGDSASERRPRCTPAANHPHPPRFCAADPLRPHRFARRIYACDSSCG